MVGSGLVRPLEDDWRETLDAVAREQGWPTSREVAKLGARVADLSAAYNDPTRARAEVREAGGARLGFAFARDVPKGAGAVRELVAAGALPLDGTLRILDWGAGFGATTWGVVRALEAAGARCTVEATWVDEDRQALEVAEAVLRRRPVQGQVALRVRTLRRHHGVIDDLARFDVVLVGQVLSELDVGVPDEARAERHAQLLRTLLERHTEPGGALVVIEPALRDRTRHLHRVRDTLALQGVTLFAPCLHSAPCPALAREKDWCHEDLSVDLPIWLVPIARAAGLRHQGLTFSYLVLRSGGTRLVDSFAAPPGGARLRVVSAPIRTKGKREAFVCGELGCGGAPAGPLLAGGGRAMRLDRDARESNAAWDELNRGDVLVVTPAPALERPRVGADTRVEHRDRPRGEHPGEHPGEKRGETESR